MKKQKKTATSWSAVNSPYTFAAIFTVIVGVIIFLSLVPEDSRFFNDNSRRERLHEKRASSTYGDDYDDHDQQDSYLQQQQQPQWQRQEQRSIDEEEDDSYYKTGQDDYDFYKNTGSDTVSTDDGDDDYAPWNDNTAAHSEPSLSRTHRVVQQRMVPPDPRETLRV